MSRQQAIEDPFPATRELWPLEPGRVFLNHGSYGACPGEVLAYQDELRARLERSPVDFMLHRMPALLEQTRQEVAQFLHARPHHLAFLTNATAGVNAVLRSLSWSPEDEILVTDHGYNACLNVVSYLSRRYGVKVVPVALPFPLSAPDQIVRSVLEAAGAKTRLALLDHVTSPTALVFPINQLARELAARGVKVLIDGAHAPGMLDLDLERLSLDGVTYYTGNLHKWCCAPKGAAFLWMAEKDQDGMHPPVISHGYNSGKPRSRFLEEFDWCGTIDPTAWLAAPRALSLLGGLRPGGWHELRADRQALLLQGREIISRVLEPQELPPPELLGQIATLQLPDDDKDELYRLLYDEYGIDAMVTSWNGKTLIRLSAAPYNTASDYHALAAALRGLAPRRGWPAL
jgi:isopenicillin-N epimerase